MRNVVLTGLVLCTLLLIPIGWLYFELAGVVGTFFAGLIVKAFFPVSLVVGGFVLFLWLATALPKAKGTGKANAKLNGLWGMDGWQRPKDYRAAKRGQTAYAGPVESRRRRWKSTSLFRSVRKRLRMGKSLGRLLR